MNSVIKFVGVLNHHFEVSSLRETCPLEKVLFKLLLVHFAQNCDELIELVAFTLDLDILRLFFKLSLFTGFFVLFN